MTSKTVTRSIAIRFRDLVQVCASLRAAVLFTPSFNVFGGYLYVSPGQSFISNAFSLTLFFFRSCFDILVSASRAHYSEGEARDEKGNKKKGYFLR